MWGIILPYDQITSWKRYFMKKHQSDSKTAEVIWICVGVFLFFFLGLICGSEIFPPSGVRPLYSSEDLVSLHCFLCTLVVISSGFDCFFGGWTLRQSEVTLLKNTHWGCILYRDPSMPTVVRRRATPLFSFRRARMPPSVEAIRFAERKDTMVHTCCTARQSSSEGSTPSLVRISIHFFSPSLVLKWQVFIVSKDQQLF